MTLSRRTLLAAAALAPARRKVLICLIDGLGPDYIAASEMPHLKRLIAAGQYREGTGMMPSLTNVNNASLATGTYPEAHGITANTFFDPALGKIVEMSSPAYLLRPTLFETAHQKGWKTAFVGAKDKIRLLIGAKAGTAVCAEKQGVPMYEAANSFWIFEQGRALLKRADVDLLYLTTSDYMMHTYAPNQSESLAHLQKLDQMLAAIVDDHPKLELYLCADHGMNAKTKGIDPVQILGAKGVRARAVAAIADKHKVHHGDLGGSVYVDLEKPADAVKARDILLAEPGIDAVLTRAEAAKRFRLMASRTGDLYVLGDRHTALGTLDAPRREVKVRTHGSLHETKIPLLVHGRKLATLETIVDLTAARAWEERV
jgi:phosphonoacetate hydrolase